MVMTTMWNNSPGMESSGIGELIGEGVRGVQQGAAQTGAAIDNYTRQLDSQNSSKALANAMLGVHSFDDLQNKFASNPSYLTLMNPQDRLSAQQMGAGFDTHDRNVAEVARDNASTRNLDENTKYVGYNANTGRISANASMLSSNAQMANARRMQNNDNLSHLNEYYAMQDRRLADQQNQPGLSPDQFLAIGNARRSLQNRLFTALGGSPVPDGIGTLPTIGTPVPSESVLSTHLNDAATAPQSVLRTSNNTHTAQNPVQGSSNGMQSVVPAGIPTLLAQSRVPVSKNTNTTDVPQNIQTPDLFVNSPKNDADYQAIDSQYNQKTPLLKAITASSSDVALANKDTGAAFNALSDVARLPDMRTQNMFAVAQSAIAHGQWDLLPKEYQDVYKEGIGYNIENNRQDMVNNVFKSNLDKGITNINGDDDAQQRSTESVSNSIRNAIDAFNQHSRVLQALNSAQHDSGSTADFAKNLKLDPSKADTTAEDLKRNNPAQWTKWDSTERAVAVKQRLALYAEYVAHNGKAPSNWELTHMENTLNDKDYQQSFETQTEQSRQLLNLYRQYEYGAQAFNYLLDHHNKYGNLGPVNNNMYQAAQAFKEHRLELARKIIAASRVLRASHDRNMALFYPADPNEGGRAHSTSRLGNSLKNGTEKLVNSTVGLPVAVPLY